MPAGNRWRNPKKLMKQHELLEQWGVSPAAVTRILRAREIDELPAKLAELAEDIERPLYHSLRWPELQAQLLDRVCGTCGVECLELEDSDGDPIRVEYLNTGDTYAPTLCRVGYPDRCRPYQICSFGPWRVAPWAYYAEKYAPRDGI